MPPEPQSLWLWAPFFEVSDEPDNDFPVRPVAGRCILGRCLSSMSPEAHLPDFYNPPPLDADAVSRVWASF